MSEKTLAKPLPLPRWAITMTGRRSAGQLAASNGVPSEGGGAIRDQLGGNSPEVMLLACLLACLACCEAFPT